MLNLLILFLVASFLLLRFRSIIGTSPEIKENSQPNAPQRTNALYNESFFKLKGIAISQNDLYLFNDFQKKYLQFNPSVFFEKTIDFLEDLFKKNASGDTEVLKDLISPSLLEKLQVREKQLEKDGIIHKLDVIMLKIVAVKAFKYSSYSADIDLVVKTRLLSRFFDLKGALVSGDKNTEQEGEANLEICATDIKEKSPLSWKLCNLSYQKVS